MRLASPPPGFCSVCFASDGQKRYIDCEADYDGAPVLDRETHTIAILPWTGDLGRQLVLENRRLKLEVEHWKASTGRFRDELNRQVDANLGEEPQPRRRRAA